MQLWDVAVPVASSLAGAIVGGLMATRASLRAAEKTVAASLEAAEKTVAASVKVAEKAVADLEATEIRKLKVDCLVAFSGLRFVLGEQLWPSLEFRSRYLYEMNKIAVLWSDDPEVLNNVRDMLNGSNNDKLVRLMRNMGRSTALPLQNLADADLMRTFLVPPQ